MLTREQFTGISNSLRTFFLFAAIVILAYPANFAFASGEEIHFSVMDWVWRFVNFGILIVLLVWFAGKPLKNFFQQRKELIEKAIREAQQAKDSAQKALADVEERLKLKDKEVDEIMAIAKSTGEAERDRLIAEGERLKAQILEQAKANIAQEVKNAKDAIRAEAVDAAMQLAEEKIKTRMTKDEQDRLLQESIKLLEGRN